MAYSTIRLDNRHRCDACRHFGKNGANFRLQVNGQLKPGRYHRPCAEAIAKRAPAEATTLVVSMGALKRQREEDAAKAFWERALPAPKAS
jgi:hypothetical protein